MSETYTKGVHCNFFFPFLIVVLRVRFHQTHSTEDLWAILSARVHTSSSNLQILTPFQFSSNQTHFYACGKWCCLQPSPSILFTHVWNAWVDLSPPPPCHFLSVAVSHSGGQGGWTGHGGWQGELSVQTSYVQGNQWREELSLWINAWEKNLIILLLLRKFMETSLILIVQRIKQKKDT